MTNRIMSKPQIAFIGAGNMATALIGGLIADGTPAAQIIASDPSSERLTALAGSGIRTTDDNAEAAAQAGLLVLAVKPQMLKLVCQELAASVQQHAPLVVSIAAGVRSAELIDWLGGGVSVIRTMPNTPAMIQCGATVLFAGPGVSAEQRDAAEHVLRAVGLTRWVDDEGLLDAVTALSGSGPAYQFLFMEAMEAAAVKLGLPAETARLLTLQTALGAARMAMESSDDLATLRDKVTSPGGTTEQAIMAFEEGGLRDLVERALGAARDRSEEISRILGQG
jgi:pyrroline-5-carboxylate reductase